MPKARIKDIEMYYEVHGTGTPLVHIGGLAGDARAWARQIEHLSKHYQVDGRLSILASIIRSSVSTTEAQDGRAVPTCPIRQSCLPRTRLV